VNLLLKFQGFFRATAKFPGYFRDRTQGGGGFHSSARNFVPLRVAEHFFELEKEKIQDGLCAKFSASSKWVFCRIRNERFQGNPGNRLAFLQWTAIAESQLSCPEIAAIQESSGLQFRALPLEGCHILCDMTTGVARPGILAEHRRGVFTSLHHNAHPGIRATRRLISSRFVWRSMNKDITS
jgi:hypothetical protein